MQERLIKAEEVVMALKQQANALLQEKVSCIMMDVTELGDIVTGA